MRKLFLLLSLGNIFGCCCEWMFGKSARTQTAPTSSTISLNQEISELTQPSALNTPALEIGLPTIPPTQTLEVDPVSETTPLPPVPSTAPAPILSTSTLSPEESSTLAALEIPKPTNLFGNLVFKYTGVQSIESVLNNFPDSALYQRNTERNSMFIRFVDFGPEIGLGCLLLEGTTIVSFDMERLFEKDKPNEFKSWESICRQITDQDKARLIQKINSVHKKFLAWEIPYIPYELFGEFSEICALRNFGGRASSFNLIREGMLINVNNLRGDTLLNYCKTRLGFIINGRLDILLATSDEYSPDSSGYDSTKFGRSFISIAGYRGNNRAIFPIRNPATGKFTFAATKFKGSLLGARNYQFINISRQNVDSLSEAIRSFESQPGFDTEEVHALIEEAVRKNEENMLNCKENIMNLSTPLDEQVE